MTLTTRYVLRSCQSRNSRLFGGLRFVRALVLRTLLVTSTLIALNLLNARPLAAQDCIADIRQCPKLVTANGDELEPSGLAWDPQLEYAIAVHDDRSTQKGYEVFAFKPTGNTGSNVTITAIPLMSIATSDAFGLDDLEGITLTDDGWYYAIGSLSLDKLEAKPSNPSVTSPSKQEEPEDSWARHQLVRFKVVMQNNSPTIRDLQRVSADRRPDFREWVISSSGKVWTNQAYRRRSENGGINVEGLASRANGDLVIGFRGPVEEGLQVPVLFLAPPDQSDEAPRARYWTHIDVQGVARPQNPTAELTEQRQRGIRGIERIPGEQGRERYVVILGHEGRRFDQLRLIVWEPNARSEADRLIDYGDLPARFVAEGVAVKGLPNDARQIEVLLVDDAGGRVMSLKITL